MKATKKMAMAISTILFCSQAFANNLFIPNYYKNRRLQNHYSALGWSERKEASLEYESSKMDATINGVDSGSTKTTDLEGNVFYRANENLNIEFSLSKEDEKEDGLDTQTTNTWELGAGFQLSEMPLAFGVSYATQDLDGDTVKTTELGVGYRLDGIFMGVGYETETSSSSGIDSTETDTVLGGGYVWGDLKKPDAAIEVSYAIHGGDDGAKGSTYGVSGIWNYEAAQIYGSFFNIDSEDDLSSTKGTMFKLGVDYSFGLIYLAPEIISANLKFTPGGAETKFTTWSVEVGHRAEGAFEVFARYTSSDTKSEGLGIEEKDLLTGFTVGGTYFF